MKHTALFIANCILIIFITLFFLSGCSSPKDVGRQLPETKIANPASVFCEKHNGTLEIRSSETGQVGYCIFPDGTECEEWAYFKGECPVKNLTNTEIKPVAIKVIPKDIEANCIGFVIGGPDETILISEIGGGWARPHPGPFAWDFIETQKGKFDFSMSDDFVKQAQNNNIAILGTIWPFADWDQNVCHSSECEVSTKDIFYPETKMGFKNGIPKSRCSPCDYNSYLTFVSKLVDRYDGNGINDMPDLKIPIKYWEVLNEPEMKSDEMTFYKGSLEDYVKILTKTADAIKTTCSDCNVLHAGAAGIQSFMLEYWGKVFDAKPYFDIANIHYIGGIDLSTLNVKDFKQLLNKKGISKDIWLTEVEFKSESEISFSVENALNAGASKVFFTQFKVGQFGLPEGGKYSNGYTNIVSKCK